ncbi:MAG: rolling circle replication-associated protein, partial [Coraliomargarita sp.]
MSRTYIKEYVPCSWFHPKGIYKVLKRFWHRLPNVSGCLFATFTIDREAMRRQGYGPSEAFDITRDRVRKMFYELRKGVEWEGKLYKIDAEYCTKVEFHDDEEGWPHFHVIWLTRRFVPAQMLSELWGFGRTNVKRIKNEDFHYLLKYVCKSGSIPEWVQKRQRLRIFQPSRGFLLPSGESSRP